jgi:hypothetical protein
MGKGIIITQNVVDKCMTAVIVNRYIPIVQENINVKRECLSQHTEMTFYWSLKHLTTR